MYNTCVLACGQYVLSYERVIIMRHSKNICSFRSVRTVDIIDQCVCVCVVFDFLLSLILF